MTNLFGDKIIKKEKLIFTYTGESFSDHKINLKDFIEELQGINFLIEETVKEYVVLGKISKEEADFEISIKIENGSVKQIIEFIKKNNDTISIVSMIIIPFLQSGVEYYLNKDNLSNNLKNDEVIQIIKDNKNIRKGFEKTLTPIKGSDNILIINTGDGDVDLNINLDNKNKIIKGVKEDNEEIKNNEEIKEEKLHGIISVSKMYDTYPFNFRIKGTENDIPMQFNDLEIDLEKRQEFLGKEMIIKAKVNYKKGKKILIEVIDYTFIENLFDDNNENKK